MDRLRKSGESCGARLTVVATGVPPGWGEPLYRRLDADHFMMHTNIDLFASALGEFLDSHRLAEVAEGQGTAAPTSSFLAWKDPRLFCPQQLGGSGLMRQ